MKYIKISNNLSKEMANEIINILKSNGAINDCGTFLLNDKSFKKTLGEIKTKFVNIDSIAIGKVVELSKIDMKEVIVDTDPYIRRSELRAELNSFETRINAKFEIVDRRLDAIETRLDTMDEKFELIEGKLELIFKQLGLITKHLGIQDTSSNSQI
ncbi:MAG: hypothetical protein LBS76_02565 [Mycoplasmataceae bacterium]|jgi:hypothetical protein|nr:hypothetical protein [Mycoplasmataceae bacterium]